MSSAGEYLKVAASQLRRAAQTRQAELDELNRQIDRSEVDRRNRISELKTQEQVRSVQMHSIEDDRIKAVLSREISQIRDQESAVDREMTRQKEVLSQQINAQRRQVDYWLQQASQLEQSASNS